MRDIGRMIGVWLLTLLISGLLIFVSGYCVTRPMIADNTYKSVLAGTTSTFAVSAPIDPADQRLLNIAYNMESGKTLQSMIAGPAFAVEGCDDLESLKIQIESAAPANTTSSMYMYGMAAVLRPLLMFFTYREISVICAIAVAVALIFALVGMFKSVGWLCTLLFAASFYIACGYHSAFVVCNALTYILTFAGIIFVCWNDSKIDGFSLFAAMGCLSFLMGPTSFGTITLTIPMLVYAASKFHDGWWVDLGSGMLCAIGWCLGYALTVAVKWTAAFQMYKLDNFEAAASLLPQNAEESLTAIMENIKLLIPFNINVPALLILIGLGGAFILFSIIYGIRRKSAAGVFTVLIFAVIPLIRFAVFPWESATYPEYTKMALWSTVFAVLLMIPQAICKAKSYSFANN